MGLITSFGYLSYAFSLHEQLFLGFHHYDLGYLLTLLGNKIDGYGCPLELEEEYFLVTFFKCSVSGNFHCHLARFSIAFALQDQSALACPYFSRHHATRGEVRFDHLSFDLLL